MAQPIVKIVPLGQVPGAVPGLVSSVLTLFSALVTSGNVTLPSLKISQMRKR